MQSLIYMKQFFTRLIILLLFSILNFYALLAQPTDCVPNSGSDATIIFGQGVVPTLNGNPLPVGAYIVAVFNSSNGLKCAGYNQWQNMPMSISPKGATTGFEGYASGETYKFRIMLPGGDVIQNDKITVTFKSPDGIICLNGNTFVADGISCIQSFQAINSESFLSVSPANINVSATGGSSTVSVTSNTNWNASSSASWLTLSPGSGTNNGTLTANYQANSSTQSRTAIITVSGAGVSSQTVNVTQAGTSPSQPFTTVWNIPSGASTLSFYIQTVGTTNYSWTAGSQSGSGTWGTTIGQVTINVSATANNTPLTLSISPDNLKRFYNLLVPENPSIEKLINVTNWGTVKWSSMAQMFSGCKNLNITGSPTPPNLENITDMSNMFNGCNILNGPTNIGSWNISNVTDMSGMFNDAYKFNQPLNNWDVSNVTNMSGMFFYASKFNQSLGAWKLNPNVLFIAFSVVGIFSNSGMACDNYSATLIGWQQNNPNVKNRLLIANGLQYGINAIAARTALINTQGWMISGDLPSGTLCSTSSNEEEKLENPILLYPNPSSGYINFESDKIVRNLEVLNYTGEVIMNLNRINSAKGDIDLSILSSGIYILKLSTDDGDIFKKISLIK